jgi:hypothetical protein
MDQTLPGVESVSCFWPGYILARNCIFPMSVEKPISVSVPQNGNFRCHRKISMVFLFPCTEISIENVTRNAACGTQTCALCDTGPVLYLWATDASAYKRWKKNICIYIFKRFLLIELWTETAGSWGCVPAKDKRMFIFLEVFRRIHSIHTMMCISPMYLYIK